MDHSHSHSQTATIEAKQQNSEAKAAFLGLTDRQTLGVYDKPVTPSEGAIPEKYGTERRHHGDREHRSAVSPKHSKSRPRGAVPPKVIGKE